MKIVLLPILLAASFVINDVSAEAADIRTLIEQKQNSVGNTVLVPTDIPYTYVVTANIRSGEGDDIDGFTAQYQVNPKAAPGSRLTFIGDALETFPQDFQDAMARLEMEQTEAEMAEEFWCTDNEEADDVLPDDFTIIREDDREAVIALGNDNLKSMLDMDGGDGMPKKILKRLSAVLTVSKPDLTMRHMKVWLTKPTTIKIIAKIKEMNIEQSCEIAPNGISYVISKKMRMKGKALGTRFSENAVITVSDLKPL